VTPLVKLEAILADDIPAEAPEIDVDALDDKAFADLKGQMRAEQPVKAEEAPKPTAEVAGDPDKEPNEVTDPADPNFRKEVPHGQWHRERERRKEAEADRQKIAENYQKLLDRTTQILQAQQPAGQEREQEPVIPTWDQDPLQAGQWTQQELIALKKRLETEDAERRQNVQAQNEWRTIIDTAREQFTAAEKTDPTVRDAYDALKASYSAELKALGHPPQAIAEQLATIEAQGIRYALQSGIPVADYVVQIATARGWQRRAAPANDAGLSEAEKIAKREETRLASQSLGKAGGAVVNTGTISPQELLDMSDADFEAYKKKHGSVAHAFRQAS
jgi:hypothetical protein